MQLAHVEALVQLHKLCSEESGERVQRLEHATRASKPRDVRRARATRSSLIVALLNLVFVE